MLTEDVFTRASIEQASSHQATIEAEHRACIEPASRLHRGCIEPASSYSIEPASSFQHRASRPGLRWRDVECDHPALCRMDPSANEPYWDQQVSAGFHYNATAAATAWAPAWTPRRWANASTGVVHMYHSARWGGWQSRLGARNDTTYSLLFQCSLLSGGGDAALSSR